MMCSKCNMLGYWQISIFDGGNGDRSGVSLRAQGGGCSSSCCRWIAASCRLRYHKQPLVFPGSSRSFPPSQTLFRELNPQLDPTARVYADMSAMRNFWLLEIKEWNTSVVFIVPAEPPYLRGRRLEQADRQRAALGTFESFKRSISHKQLFTQYSKYMPNKYRKLYIGFPSAQTF